MCNKSFVGADVIPKEDQSECQSYEVHIGVFFEGSGFNMVRECINSESFFSDDERNGEYVKNLIDTKSHLKMKQESCTQGDGIWESIAVELTKIDESLQDYNTHPHIAPDMLCQIEKDRGRKVGFTNLSLLYSLFTGEKLEGNNIFKRIYIEGAGTSDISKPNDIPIKGYRMSELDGIFGIGLGYGDTGVVALVSKAAMKVTEVVKSLLKEYRTDSNAVNLHFYLFGFSRGAACSRLFCHLLTRSVESRPLKCEKEFSKYAKSLMKVNRKRWRLEEERLDFLEEYKSKNKITVEFVGLFDTVSSIGFLKRKDGTSTADTLGVAGGLVVGGVAGGLAGPEGAIAGASVGVIAGGVIANIKANVSSEWHYNNVEKYGLYIDGKVESVCHICAMDEFRENYALVNIGNEVPKNGIEIMIPGCHSDVGGSYLDEEKECIIQKKGSYNRYKNSYNRYKMCLHSSNVKPTCDSPGIVADVNSSTLQYLGWINGDNDGDNDGDNAKVIKENDNYVKMRRSIKRGYSDIPLAMMMQYFCQKVEKKNFMRDSKFFTKIPLEHNYNQSKLSDLKKIGDNFVARVKRLKEGHRWWLLPFPHDSFSYKQLRSKYLHFSAKPDVMNRPNYNEDFVMCRITYHGDNVEQKSSAEGVHFLYELQGETDLHVIQDNPFIPCGNTKNHNPIVL